MSKWQIVSLKDILASKGYIRGPFGSALKRGEMCTCGIPVYEQEHAINEIRHFRYFVDEKKYRELERFTVEENDIIVSCSGTVGRVSVIKRDDPKGIISQALLILRVNSQIVDVNYLKYFLRSSVGQNSILERSNGSVQVNICKRATIESIAIPLPSLSIQRQIVKVLSSIDDKIELNAQINHNLEEQAKAIFKSWFVDFSAVTNGEFGEDDGIRLPMGWKKSCLSDVATYLNGLAMQKYRPQGDDNGYPVLKIKELRQGMCDCDSERCSSTIKSEYVVHDGDVIFSWSGSLLVDLWCGGDCGLNQHLFKVTSSAFDKWFYYSWTKYHLDEFIAIAADKATTMGHIKRENLQAAIVLVPPSDVYAQVGNILGPIYDKIIQNRVESRRLAQLRDALLPKLMSGEIDVSEVEATLSKMEIVQQEGEV